MMKTLDEYMKLPYRMEIIPDPDEGGYVISYPDLPGCLSIADTMSEALKKGEDAKKPGLKQPLKTTSRSECLHSWRPIPVSSNCVYQEACTGSSPNRQKLRASV